MEENKGYQEGTLTKQFNELMKELPPDCLWVNRFGAVMGKEVFEKMLEHIKPQKGQFSCLK
jgi:hypothetical protein